jgi:hypothetical protein
MVGINVGDEGSVPTFGFGQILTAGFARHLGTILNHGQFAEESTSKDLVVEAHFKRIVQQNSKKNAL